MVLGVDEPIYVSPRNLSFGARQALYWHEGPLGSGGNAVAEAAFLRSSGGRGPQRFVIPSVIDPSLLPGGGGTPRNGASRRANGSSAPAFATAGGLFDVEGLPIVPRSVKESRRRKCPPPHADTDVVNVGVLGPEDTSQHAVGLRTLQTVRKLVGDDTYLLGDDDAHREDSTSSATPHPPPQKFHRKPCHGLWVWQSRDFNLNHNESEKRTPQQIAADQRRERDRHTRRVFMHHLRGVAMYRPVNRIALRHSPPTVASGLSDCDAVEGGYSSSDEAHPPPASLHLSAKERGTTSAVHHQLRAVATIPEAAPCRAGTIVVKPASQLIAAASCQLNAAGLATMVPAPPATDRRRREKVTHDTAAVHHRHDDTPPADATEGRPLSSRVRRKIMEMASRFL